MFRKILVAAAVLALCSPLQAIAENPDFPGKVWPGMSGAWGGARDSLKDSGITLTAAYIGEFVRNFDPGLLRFEVAL